MSLVLTDRTSSAVPAEASSSTPLRVSHLSLTLKTGGLERILADLAKHHQRERCIPHFVAMREVGRFAEEIRAAGCPVLQLQPGSRLQQVRELARWLRAQQIDVLHTHNTYPHLYGTLAARWAGVSVVVQTRHGQRAGHGWKSRVMYRAAATWVDRVVAVSDDAANLCIDADGLPAAKVQRIWNGIDLSAFRYRGPVQEPVAISVARLSPEKDFATLLWATAQVLQEVPDFRLKLVGDGPEREKLQRLARAIGLTDRVEWLGERKDIPDLLATAGFFVTSSLTEGISLTLLEAMAVGLPVVATDAGGNREIVVDGVTGSITPIGDVQRLAQAMIAMCRRSPEWPELGRAGCERVREHFSIERMVRDYEQLYEDLCTRRSTAARLLRRASQRK